MYFFISFSSEVCNTFAFYDNPIPLDIQLYTLELFKFLMYCSQSTSTVRPTTSKDLLDIMFILLRRYVYTLRSKFSLMFAVNV